MLSEEASRSKHALPGVWKNQYQGQRRPVWGFEAESQEILLSGGYNKDQSTASGRKGRTQGRDGDKEFSILGHGEIDSTGEDQLMVQSMALALVLGSRACSFLINMILGKLLNFSYPHFHP